MQVLYSKEADGAAALMLLATVAYADLPVRLTLRNDNKAAAAHAPSSQHTDGSVDDAEAAAAQAGGLAAARVACGAAPTLALLDEDGVDCDVCEPYALLRYVARLETHDTHHMYGRTPVEASQVDAWIDFAVAELQTAMTRYRAAADAANNKSTHNSGSSSEPSSRVTAALAALERVVAALDTALTIRTFLVGERMTIADIAVAFALHSALRGVPATTATALARTHRAAYRHYNTVMRCPKVRDVMRREGAAIGPAY